MSRPPERLALPSSPVTEQMRKFESVNITTAGGSFLWICNGADAPRHWNGSAWATPTLSGVTATDIVSVDEFSRNGYLSFSMIL